MHRSFNLRRRVATFVLALSGCSGEPLESIRLPHPSDNRAPSPGDQSACATATYSDATTHPVYWPPGAFQVTSDEFLKLNPNDDRNLDSVAISGASFRAAWYSRHLCAMGEAPLIAPESGGTRVRLLWLRTFHSPVAVRIEHDDRSTTLVAIELDGQGGYEPGSVTRRVERELLDSEWHGLTALLSEFEFWQSPTALLTLGMDGANWIVEVSEPERYLVVDRWGGSAIGEYILNLTGLDFEPVY